MAKRGKITNKNTKLFRKLCSILSDGYDDVLYEYEYFELETDAFQREIQLINEHGLPSLCNLTAGGIGGDCISNHPNKEEIFRKRSENFVPWNKGIPMTEEMKKTISDTKLKFFEDNPHRKINAGTYKAGTDHVLYGTTQAKSTVNKRVQKNKDNGVYERTRNKMKIEPNLPSNKRPINQLTLDGSFIKTFSSTSEAALELNIPRYRIKNTLGKHQHQTGGFKFIYAEEN